MLYIDQLFGAGLSTSNSTQPLNSTDATAALVWEFIQVFHDQFPQYESRDFGMWSTSYGGRTCNSKFSFFPPSFLMSHFLGVEVTCGCKLVYSGQVPKKKKERKYKLR